MLVLLGALSVSAPRNVVTSTMSWPNITCTSRKRRPMMKARRNSGLTCSGRASVAMSKSFGVMPSSRSRTAPPTTKAEKPASRSAAHTLAADGLRRFAAEAVPFRAARRSMVFGGQRRAPAG